MTILSFLIAAPLLGALGLAFLPRSSERAIKYVALFIVLVEFALSLVLPFGFRAGASAMQFAEQYAWFPQFGISYHVGIDGLGLPPRHVFTVADKIGDQEECAREAVGSQPRKSLSEVVSVPVVKGQNDRLGRKRLAAHQVVVQVVQRDCLKACLLQERQLRVKL